MPDAIRLFRIGDGAGVHPVWDAGGAVIWPGRWHEAGVPVIYAAEVYALAMLEKLAHWNGLLPSNQHYVEAAVPAGVSYEVFQPAAHVGWNDRSSAVARGFGGRWLREGRTALLFVPSVLSPHDRNVLVNPAHPDNARIVPGLEVPVPWDDRLLRP